jgi:hypothetical protein
LAHGLLLRLGLSNFNDPIATICDYGLITINL